MLPFNYFTHRTTPGAKAIEIEGDVWRLEIPGGPGGRYRLAQLDDCDFVRQRRFRWKASCTMELTGAGFYPGDPRHLGIWLLE